MIGFGSRTPIAGSKTIYGNADIKVIETTAGRVIFNRNLAERTWFLQQSRGQEATQRHHLALLPNLPATTETVATLDKLKELGFREATAPVSRSASRT